MKNKIDNKTFTLIKEWLMSDSYSEEEAVRDLEEATIVEETVISINYKNGVKDLIQIKNNKVVHLNPYHE
jgi:hypothetical protein